MLEFDDDNEDIDVARVHEWNIAQLVFASFGTCALYAFVKIPLMQFYGSGWSIVMFVAYLFLLAPIMYVQLRLGSQYRRSLISLFSKFWPFGKGVAIAFLIRNMLTVIMHSAVLMLTISYVAFSLYRCDPRICTDNLYMWSSCLDQWSSSQCSNERKVTIGPSPEIDFFNRFVYGQTDQIAYMDTPSQGGFPNWWAIYGINHVFLLLTWIIICLCTVLGVRAFGYVLYGIAPLAFVGLVIMIGWVYGSVVKLDQQALQNVLSTFYSNFATATQQLQTAETYSWNPLEYGFAGMLVQMCFSLQLWSGQYTSMGKFVGYGRRTMKSVWLIPLGIFAVFGALPTVILCGIFSATYDSYYLRLHVATGYPMPFIVFSRVFSKVSISPAIAVVFFITLFLFTLISICLLILTCTDNIIDSLRRSSRSVERNVELARRYCTFFTCVVLYLLSILLITKAGIFWIMLLDSFIDRFMCVLIPLAAIGYLIAYVRSTNGGRQRGCLIAAFLLAVVCTTGAFGWYLYSQSLPANIPSYHDYTLSTKFIIVGWLIAASPIVIGLPLGFLLSVREADGRAGERCRRLCCGATQNNLPYFPRGDGDSDENRAL